MYLLLCLELAIPAPRMMVNALYLYLVGTSVDSHIPVANASHYSITCCT